MRTALTVTLVCIAAPLALLCSPLWLLVGLAGDLLRRSRWAWCRGLLFLQLFLLCEWWGIAASGWMWIRHRRGTPGWVDGHYAVQRRWAGWLWGGLVRLFQLDVQVEGAEQLARGPLLAFFRHASTADTIAPMAWMAIPHRVRPRYVIKAELRWDPCLDLVGGRIPNAFVQRGAADAGPEIARVRALADDLGPQDAVVIFPEGTRFTAARRQRIIARAQVDDPALAAVATGLRWTLPPRPGGLTALLQAAPQADVALVGHVGFEGARSMADLFNGRLIGRRVRGRVWRFPADTVPRDAPYPWFLEQWQALDRWIDGASGAAP